jgi:DNA repair protein RecN (Recombination protein N)
VIVSLKVNNYLFFKDESVGFSKNFNVITGETGSGKSLVLNAIGLLSGKGKDLDQNYYIEGLIDTKNGKLKELGIKSGEVIFSVEKGSKRKIYRINGRMFPQEVVEDILNDEITFHWQNTHVKFLKKNFILHFLDNYANLSKIMDNYSEIYNNIKKIEEIVENNDIERLKSDIEDISEKIEKIESVKPDIEEEKTLTDNYNALIKISTIKENISSSIELIESSVDNICKADSKLEELDLEKMSDDTESLRTTTDILNTVKRDLEEYSGNIENIDIHGIESRIWQYNDLKRKYGPTTEDVLKNLEKWDEKLKELNNKKTVLEEASGKLAVYRKELNEKGTLLSTKRQECAKKVQNLINGNVTFNFTKCEPSPSGIDDVELMGDMAGLGMQPLRKVASGGEMSRIMLAIELVLSKEETLVFDEIDVGIGGITANKLAAKLKEISGNCQLIVVTHLPQLVSKADRHIGIRRDGKSGHIVTFTKSESIEEMKRMVGSEEVLGLFD